MKIISIDEINYVLIIFIYLFMICLIYLYPNPTLYIYTYIKWFIFNVYVQWSKLWFIKLN